MKTKIWILSAFVLVGLSWAHFGCIKGNPVGADIATLANTTITVVVKDGTAPQPGITVQTTDPSGAIVNTLTDSTGTAIISAKLAGQWVVTIPTQKNFFQSSTAVNVLAGSVGPSVSFTAQGQILIVSPLTPETYGISGANISYQITYNQPSNLTEPVSLAVVGPLTQTGWAYNFSPPVIGGLGNISILNIIIPQGAYLQPSFTINALKNDGSFLTNAPARAINRNYSVQSNFFVNNAPTTSTGGGAQFVTVTGNIILSTVNAGDATTNWLCTISGQLLDSGAGYGPVTLGFNGCPTLALLTSDGSFNGGGSYFFGSYTTCGPIQQDSFQILPGQLKPVTLVVNCGQIAVGNSINSGGRNTGSSGFVLLNAKLTSAVAMIQGSVTFGYNAGAIPVGTVFNLTN